MARTSRHIAHKARVGSRVARDVSCSRTSLTSTVGASARPISGSLLVSGPAETSRPDRPGAKTTTRPIAIAPARKYRGFIEDRLPGEACDFSSIKGGDDAVRRDPVSPTARLAAPSARVA